MNIEKEVANMRRMTAGELADKYAQVFGEATRSRHKEYLIKRIAWRIQANLEGDLSERARRRASELANDADLRVTAPTTMKMPIKRTKARLNDQRLPMSGAEITRDYKGQTVAVKVIDGGFEYEGEFYKSLTAVAKAVTGKHWNGYHFFGLRKKAGA